MAEEHAVALLAEVRTAGGVTEDFDDDDGLRLEMLRIRIRLADDHRIQIQKAGVIGKLGAEAALRWPDMQSKVEWVPNALTSRKPLLLTASKDKPVLISALAAKCKVLLTPDKADSGLLLGTTVYGMRVDTPCGFLAGEGLG